MMKINNTTQRGSITFFKYLKGTQGAEDLEGSTHDIPGIKDRRYQGRVYDSMQRTLEPSEQPKEGGSSRVVGRSCPVWGGNQVRL